MNKTTVVYLWIDWLITRLINDNKTRDYLYVYMYLWVWYWDHILMKIYDQVYKSWLGLYQGHTLSSFIGCSMQPTIHLSFICVCIKCTIIVFSLQISLLCLWNINNDANADLAILSLSKRLSINYDTSDRSENSNLACPTQRRSNSD